MTNSKHTEGRSIFGRTLLAAKNLKKGELVVRDTGPVTSIQTVYSYQVGWNKHFEPLGPSKIINHSCEPNLGISVKSGGKPKFYALRDIKRGEELCVNYETFDYETAYLFKKKCRCGAKNCKKRIRGFKTSSKSILRKYAPYVAEYLLDGRKPGLKSHS